MNVLATYQNQTQSYNNTNTKPLEKKTVYKPDVLDILSEHVVNRRDLTDTVTIPRAIFKGYLCFTVGTAVNAISGILQQGKLSKGLSIAGSLVSIYGTYNFVKGFLVQDKHLTEDEK